MQFVHTRKDWIPSLFSSEVKTTCFWSCFPLILLTTLCIKWVHTSSQQQDFNSCGNLIFRAQSTNVLIALDCSVFWCQHDSALESDDFSVRFTLKIQHVANSHKKWGLWCLALINFVLNGSRAVERELLAFREQPGGKEIPSRSLPGVGCESVGRIWNSADGLYWRSSTEVVTSSVSALTSWLWQIDLLNSERPRSTKIGV